MRRKTSKQAGRNDHATRHGARWRHGAKLLVLLGLSALGACAAQPGPQIVERAFPASLESFTEAPVPTRVVLSDGHQRPMRFWGEPGGNGRILLAVHGFGDRAQQFDRLARNLTRRDRDLMVLAYDQRSFGGTVEYEAPWPGSDVLVADLRDVYGAVMARYPGREVFVLGHSMGAAVAVVAFTGADRPAVGPRGLILAAPALCATADLGYLDAGVFGLIGKVFDTTTVSTVASLKEMTGDETLVAEMLAPGSGYHDRVPLGKVLRSTKLYDKAARRYDRLELPTLILHGVEDNLIDARLIEKRVRRFKKNHEASSGAWLDAVFFDRRGHLLLSEAEPTPGNGANPVHETIAAFLAEGPESYWIKERAHSLTRDQAEQARWAKNIARCTSD